MAVKLIFWLATVGGLVWLLLRADPYEGLYDDEEEDAPWAT